MPVYTAELYPTAIRNAGVGACNVAAGVALIIVPYLSILVRLILKYFQLFLYLKQFHGHCPFFLSIRIKSTHTFCSR